MQSIQVSTTFNDNSLFWENEITSQTTWSQTNIATYQSKLQDHSINLAPLLTNKQLATASQIFTNQLALAKESFTHTNKKRKRYAPSSNTDIHKLLQEKKKLLNTSTSKKGKQNGPRKDSLWTKIHSVNNEIHKLAYASFVKEHDWWWNTLSNIDCSHDAKGFWKLVKNVRKPPNSNPFPSIIHHSGSTLTTKDDIKASICSYFSDVAEGNDQEALDFKNSFPPLTPPADAPPLTPLPMHSPFRKSPCYISSKPYKN
jgi:hypothetical protein